MNWVWRYYVPDFYIVNHSVSSFSTYAKTKKYWKQIQHKFLRVIFKWHSTHKEGFNVAFKLVKSWWHELLLSWFPFKPIFVLSSFDTEMDLKLSTECNCQAEAWFWKQLVVFIFLACIVRHFNLFNYNKVHSLCN